ncbi:MAG TPA: DUF6600 domain-containing protein [Candidatus Binatia bacterium]|jgi:hypothetical protein
MRFHRLAFCAPLAMAGFVACSSVAMLSADLAAPSVAAAQDIDDAYFYSALAPNGEWFYQADLGWAWHPTHVGPGWRPYTEGRWEWSDDYGWTWVSDEPWGWATYHYGRWYFDPYYGWSWIPGHVWAPAWVSWRSEAGYVGWAPLWPAFFDEHPEYRWDSWDHDRDWDSRNHDRDWDRWIFTRDRDFTSDRVGRLAVRDMGERDDIFRQSRDVTRFDQNRPEQIGHSIDRTMIERAVGHPVRTVHVETSDRPVTNHDAHSDRIQMFRPHVRETPDRTPDRLGLAKPASQQPHEADTIRKEKQRIDAVPEKDRTATGRQHPREGHDEHGAAPSAVERENARPNADAGQNRENQPGGREPQQMQQRDQQQRQKQQEQQQRQQEQDQRRQQQVQQRDQQQQQKQQEQQQRQQEQDQRRQQQVQQRDQQQQQKQQEQQQRQQEQDQRRQQQMQQREQQQQRQPPPQHPQPQEHGTNEQPPRGGPAPAPHSGGPQQGGPHGEGAPGQPPAPASGNEGERQPAH